MPQPNLADSFHGPVRYNTVPDSAKNNTVPDSAKNNTVPDSAKNNTVPGFAKNNIVLGSSTGLTPRLNLVPQAPAGREGLNNSNPATTPTPPVTPLPSNPSTGADSPPTRPATPTDDDESPAHRWLPALLILLLLLGIGWFVKTRIDTRLARQAAEQAALSDRLNSLNDNASLNNLNVANLTSKLATIENLNVTDTATINHLRVTGDSNLNGGVAITGPLTLNGDLVSNSTTTNSSTTNGNSTTTGQGTFGSILVQGDATVQGNTSLNSLSAGATTLNSLIVSGNTSLGGGSSIAQNLSVGGNLSVQGNTTLNTLTASAFFGNGAGLTNLNATNITSGTLQDARLSSNVALLDRANQTFIGNNTFGSNLSVQGTTSLQALNVASGLTVSSASPIVATFNGRVVGTDAINTNEFVTLGQLTTVSAGNFFIQNGNSFGTTAMLGTNDAFGLALETGGVERLRITPTGNVGIGTSSPVTKLQISDGNSVNPGLITSDLVTITAQGIAPGLSIVSVGTAAGHRAVFKGVRANGTLAAPIAPNVDDNVLSFLGAIYDGIATQGTAMVSFSVDGAVSPGIAPQRIGFFTSTTDASSRIERLTIKSSGNVGIGTTAPGYKLDVSGGTGIVAQFSGRVIGGNAINSNEFTTKSQLDAVTSGTAGAFIQNGNSFGTTAMLGTNDAFGLALETGGVERLRIDTSGNVGIGTTAPGALLDVNGSVRFGTITTGNGVSTGDTKIELGQLRTGDGNSYIDFHATTAADFNLRILRSPGADGSASIVNNGTGLLGFGTGNVNNRLVLDSAGNVGIGTSAPLARLDVAGVSGDLIRLSPGTGAITDSGYLQVNGRARFGYDGASIAITDVGANKDFTITNGGAERFRVQNATGNVGIGTSAPGAKLHVTSSVAGTVGQIIRGAASQTADLQQWQNSAGTVLARVDANGNGFFANGSGGTGAGFVQGGNSFGALATLGTNDAFGLALETGGVERLRIDTSGNVGIGTTAPGSKLHVIGVNSVIKSSSAAGSGGGALMQGIVDADNSFSRAVFSHNAYWDETTNLWNAQSIGANDMQAMLIPNVGGFQFITHASTGNIARTFTHADFIAGAKMTIEMGGDVGIGITDPAFKLDVSGGTGIVARFSGRVIGGNAINSNEFTTKAQLDAVTSGTAGAFIQNGNSFGTTAMLGTNDAFDLQFETGGTTKLTIQNSTGNVGIGTTTPASTLHVQGNAQLGTSGTGDRDLVLHGSVAGQHVVLQTRAAYNALISNNTQLIASVTGNNSFVVQTNGVNSRLTVTGSGNVGIGLTDPAHKLQVETGGGGTSGYISVSAGGSTLSRLNVGFSASGVSQNITPAQIFADATGDLTFSSRTNNASGMHFFTNPSTSALERMTILSSGNVGIGTTAPGARLDVYNPTATSNVDLFQLRSDVGSANNIKFRVDSDGDIFTDGSVTIATPADIAEHYQNSDGAQPGEVVVFTGPTSVAKSSTAAQTGLAGVVSTNPGLRLSTDTGGVPVALSGRVPTKVSTANGPIEIGDYLTSGPNGTALKATQAGPTIGTALEPATSDTTIEVFVHLGHYTPTQTQTLQSGTGSALTQTQGSAGAFTSLNVSGATTLTSLTVTGAATFQSNLSVAGTLTTQDIVVRGHIVGNEDTRGEVVVPAGTLNYRHDFATAYAAKPFVVATPVNKAVLYRVVADSTGFTIYLNEAQVEPLGFTYMVQQ